jgi:hypothetical protein
MTIILLTQVLLTLTLVCSTTVVALGTCTALLGVQDTTSRDPSACRYYFHNIIGRAVQAPIHLLQVLRVTPQELHLNLRLVL